MSSPVSGRGQSPGGQDEPLEQVLARESRGTDDHVGAGLRARWVLDAMSGVLALLAPDGSTVEFNRAALDLAAAPRRELLGRPFWELPQWASDGATAELLRAAVTEAAAGTSARVEALLADGAVLEVELRPLTDPSGEVRLLAAEGRDVTDHLALADRLRAVDRRRRHFVQAVGHDLKSPLAVLMALTARARERGAGPDDLDGIAAAARAVADRVDELLAAARESDEAMAPALTPIDLAHIVREAVQGLSAIAFERGVRVDVVAPPTCSVVGDRRRLASVLVNLVGNALRYAEHAIEVRLAVVGSLVRLTVADDGPGVPVRMREEIFERFSQGEDPSTTGAVGLGLAIVRDVVTLHSGSVRIGAGSLGGASFTVELPRAMPTEVRPSPRSDPAVHHEDAFDAAPVGLGIVGADGRWQRVNPALAAVLGREEQALVGRPVVRGLAAVVCDPLERALAGRIDRFEAEQTRAGAGRDRLLLWTGAVSRLGGHGDVVVLSVQEVPRPAAARVGGGARGGGPHEAGPPASRARQGGARRTDGSGTASQAARKP